MAIDIFGHNIIEGNQSIGGQYYQLGRVKSIVLGPNNALGKKDENYNSPSDIGAITYELLYSPIATSKAVEVTEPAYPIWKFIQQYPVLNELVMIIVGPSIELNDGSTKQQYYYMPTYNIWNSPNHNAFPNMQEWQSYLKQYSNNQPGYSGKTNTYKSLPLGYSFEENGDIKDLQHFEGDTIMQGRFGQSIRFGSTTSVQPNANTWSRNNQDTNGDPITIITNRQGKRVIRNKFDPIVEDINKDGSSIYMTSTQEINITDIVNFPLRSFNTSIKDTSIINTIGSSTKPISNQALSANEQDINSIG